MRHRIDINAFLHGTLGASLVLLAAGCAGRAPARGAPGAEPETLAAAWSVPLDAAADLQVEAAPGAFVVGAATGRLLKVAAEDGAVLWNVDLGARLAGRIAVGPPPPGRGAGWIAAPLEDGAVALVPLGTGTPPGSWSPGWRPAALVALRGRVFAVSESGEARLYAVSSASEVWRARLPAPSSGAAAWCAGAILVGLADGRIAGLDAETGAVRWSEKLGSPTRVTPACDGRRAFVATEDNVLHALRLYRRGAGVMWRARSGADPAAPPVAAERLAMLLSKDTYLYAFRQRNGHLAFRARLDRRPGPAALLGGLLLVAGGQAERLDGFRLPEGRGAGAFTLPEGTRFVTPPVVSEGRVAIALARYGENRSRLVGLAARREAAAP